MTEQRWTGRARRGAGRLVVSVLAPAALLAGCGDDVAGDAQPEAQPAPDVSVFSEGDFDGLPVPPLADPVGPRSEYEDVTARSFTVRNTTPEEVVEFYDTALGDWTKQGSEDVGTAIRSDYEKGGRGLRVTVQRAPTIEDDAAELQLSLQLGPPERVFASA